MKEEQIEDILQTAYDNVPYYNHIFRSLGTEVDFEEIPCLTKDKIYEFGPANFISGECREALENDPQSANRIYRIERTSGTTREPLQVLWKRQDYLLSVRHHWKLRKQFGIYPESRGVIEERSSARERPVRIRDERLIWNIDRITEDSMNQLIEALEEFLPEWLCLPASRVFLLLHYLKRNGKKMPESVRYIEFLGEPLLDYYRDCVEKEIPVKTANMYGCVETNGIAFECEYRKLHLMEENVYTEIVEGNRVLDRGETGNVCVTGYYNRTMPFLRYRLNDRACMPEHGCMCKSRSPVLELKNVRLPNLLFFADRSVYGDGELLYPANNVDAVPVYENSIFFAIHLCRGKILERYTVEFEQVPETKRRKAENVFTEILEAFGIRDISFEFVYSEHIDKDMQYGFLTIFGR